MATITTNTTITLPAGQMLVFGLGGSATAIIDGNVYDIGLGEKFFGPFTANESVQVVVRAGTITYSIETDGAASRDILQDPITRQLTPGSADAVRGAVTDDVAAVGRAASGAISRPSRLVKEATDLVARMTNAPSAGRQNAISRLIAQLKRSGVWSQLDALYVLCSHDEQAALLNWVGGSFNLTRTGGTFTAGYGWTGDGISGFLDTGFNPATASTPKFVRDSASFGIVTHAHAFGEGSNIFGAFDGTNGCQIATRNSPNTTRIRINQGTATDITGSLTGQGVFGVNRSGASATQLYVDGEHITSGTAASVAPISANFAIGRLSASIYSGVSPVAAAWIGASLTAEQHKALAGALRDFVDACTAISITPAWAETAQTYMGGYVEIQPDSYNGGTTRPAIDGTTDTWGFPASLNLTEQERLRAEWFPGDGTGLMYLRLPLGFAYRGGRVVDAGSGLIRQIGERWSGQNAALTRLLANVVQQGGGLAPEYWGVAPHWTTTGQFGGAAGTPNTLTAGGSYPRATTLASIRGTDATQYNAQIAAFTDSIINDLEYLHTNVAPVRMFGLQNEPSVNNQEYGSCGYTDAVYSDVMSVLVPKIRASAVLSTWGGSANTVRIHVGSDNDFAIGATYIASKPGEIWSYSYHKISEIGEDANWIRANMTTFGAGKSQVWVNETEYFVPGDSSDQFKAANNMLRDVLNLVYGNAPVSMPVIHICKQIGQTSTNSNTSGYALVECNLPGAFAVAEGAAANPQPAIPAGEWRPVAHNYNAARLLFDNVPVGSVRIGGTVAGLPRGVGFVAFRKPDGGTVMLVVNRHHHAITVSIKRSESTTVRGSVYSVDRIGDYAGEYSGSTIAVTVPPYSGIALS
jgi:Glycosyl hydrolase family 30 beta sandwich domain